MFEFSFSFHYTVLAILYICICICVYICIYIYIVAALTRTTTLPYFPPKRGALWQHPHQTEIYLCHPFGPPFSAARCLVHPATPSLFAGNYIDRWFSSSSGNIGEPRPRCSSRYPTLLASSFNLLFLHHFTPFLSP